MLDILRFEEKEVRVEVDENGDPLFCASDVARCLGYARPSEAVKDHCKGTLKRRILTAGGNQEASFIKGQCYIVTKLQDHPFFVGKSVVINSRVLNIVPSE